MWKQREEHHPFARTSVSSIRDAFGILMLALRIIWRKTSPGTDQYIIAAIDWRYMWIKYQTKTVRPQRGLMSESRRIAAVILDLYSTRVWRVAQVCDACEVEPEVKAWAKAISERNWNTDGSAKAVLTQSRNPVAANHSQSWYIYFHICFSRFKRVRGLIHATWRYVLRRGVLRLDDVLLDNCVAESALTATSSALTVNRCTISDEDSCILSDC